MVKTIYAVDNEFAAASGGNVNFSPDWSYFDNPPNSTSNLTITSNAGDENPFLFETGETYDLTWTGNGGGTMEDAVIIRSDILAPGQGAVVFEGINSNTGELYQIAWSPGHDLEQWFYDNAGASGSPAFYTSNQDPDTYGFVCFAAGTLIDTPAGPTPIEHLASGDQVMTLDSGTQRIQWIGHRTAPAIGNLAPVTFEPDTYGNDAPLTVSANHRILLASQLCDIYFDTPEVWVPAKALVNGRDVRFTPRKTIAYYHILLQRHEVLIANSMAAESLLLGSETRRILGPEIRQAIADDSRNQALFERPMRPSRPILSYSEARFLVTSMDPSSFGEVPKDLSEARHKPPAF